jgi:hypothetical protein
MSFRTNPDRILDQIDRARSREDDGGGVFFAREASARVLGTEPPEPGSTPGERVRRIFKLVDQAYREVAGGGELKKMAARFQAIGDLSGQNARGDITITVHYLDHARSDDVGMIPVEVKREELQEAKKVTGTSRPDVNALKVLRELLRNGVQAAYSKLEPRLKDAIRERADLGHISLQVSLDLRAAD